MSKLPKELDPEDVYNKLRKMIFDFAKDAQELNANENIAKEQKYESIKHIGARACGVCDVIRELGYDVRNEQGAMLTKRDMNKLFALEQSNQIEMEKQRKENA